MDLKLFENRGREKDNTGFVEKFIEELQKVIISFDNKNNLQESIVLEEYNLFEKRKVFLDNKSRYGNDFAWITDENSVCISEHGDGGPYSISEINLPHNAKTGEVYEKINGTYIYNDIVTKEINNITK